ncbi:MAG: choloylglycine hydrolase family protein, partial [Candidatus Omnitrophica bacterium]|nr:choloylglycine hydrolase family protein [Candidatus Omnitrophota bacterium]
LIIFFMAQTAAGFACTDFVLKAEDGAVINTRTNEFAIPANSNIVFEPAGKDFSSVAPEEQRGLSWKSRYSYLGINGMGLSDKFVDGMNEAGLSVGCLLFLESKYETIHKPESAISNLDFVSWILGNFATVEELKKELPKVRVWMETVPGAGAGLPLHVAVHDAKGNNLVVEFINGEKKVYDNPIGVLTNMPEFPWQITNLRAYLNLNPFNALEKDFAGITVKPFGQGSGWLGLPADWTPPSRFIRIVQIQNAAYPAKDAKTALSLAVHIINNVDIPSGVIRETQADGTIVSELTQWTVFKDLTNKVLYFKSYDNSNLRFIDLKKLANENKSAGKALTIPISQGGEPQDLTGNMVWQ